MDNPMCSAPVLSLAVEAGSIIFPNDLPLNKIYMMPFTVVDKKALPGWDDLKGTYDCYASIIDQMIHGLDVESGYLMVDRSELKAGQYHRSPGVHVDGEWRKMGWSHNCGNHYDLFYDKQNRQKIILASDYPLCKVYEGSWSGICGEKGDCSSVFLDGLTEKILEANKVYVGGASTLLHESIPSDVDIVRTVARIHCYCSDQ